MNKKLIGIIICTIFIVTSVLPATGLKNNVKTKMEIEQTFEEGLFYSPHSNYIDLMPFDYPTPLEIKTPQFEQTEETILKKEPSIFDSGILEVVSSESDGDSQGSSIAIDYEGTIHATDEGEPLCVPSDTVEYWAVLVGFNETRFVEDTEQVRRSLIYQGWKEDHIKILYYRNATRSDLIEAIDWVVGNEDPWDTTLIYLRSHGGEGFFCLVGGNMYYEELDRELDRLRSAAVGVVVDTCHSGSAIPHLKQNGRVIITACKANQTSGGICDGIANGLDEFADYRIQVGNRNGVVSMEEVFDYISHENNFNTYEPQIQDDCPGDLHITFLDWENSLLDQMPNSTSFGPGLSAVILWNNGGTIYDRQRAQSFQPSAGSLEKVRFHIEKWTLSDNVSSPIVVSIRKELTGEDLTSKMLLPDEVHPGYTTFDFPDINVTPGETYYIVCRATEEETDYDNRYVIRDDGDCYDKGMAYYTNDGQYWRSHEDSDLFFATYRKNNDESLSPYVPGRPVGPVYGEKNIFYNYCVSTEDVNDDSVYYQFGWGDNTSSGWLGPYESGEAACSTHSWVENGTYHVMVKAKDKYGMENNWSSILRVKIGNEQPNPPFIDGPPRGKVGEEYEYAFNATDPNGDDVLYYYVDWDDGQTEEWVGPYDSGEEVTLSHTFDEKGTYLISAKAKDIHDAEGDWGYLEVTMPKDKPFSFQFNRLVFLFERSNCQNSQKSAGSQPVLGRGGFSNTQRSFGTMNLR
ncbi:hypothetical protein MBGDF03_00355 [Thermoplasmatales archaeon SCGC AB-540-F20]|nr:hypothetical protein MBGDF03_00355 [Thermoplasmatales archaeon SCGC AB-540-F20]